MAQGEFVEVGEQLLEYQTPLTDEAAQKMLSRPYRGSWKLERGCDGELGRAEVS